MNKKKRNWFQRLFSETPEKRTFTIKTEKIGSVGTEVYSGYIHEEYLHALTGRERATVFDKMRRSDSQVNMCLSAVKSPIKAANWEIRPADQNNPDDVEDAKLIEHILFKGMDKDWDEFISEALVCIDFGYSVFEMVDKIVMEHPEFGPHIGLKNLAFRSPKTIERWNFDKKTEELFSISQYAYGDLDFYNDIPAEFLLILTLGKEGANFEGVSALRSCYGNWFRKNQYLKSNSIGIDKFAVPTPIVTVPTGQESGDQFENMVSVLEKYQSHENNYITKPQGWDIILNANVYDPQKVETSIDNEDKRMAKAFMANFLELGTNGFGSQSLSLDLSDFFLFSLDHIAKIITNKMNKIVIPRMVELNRGPRGAYPKLVHSGISDRAGKELAEVMQLLTGSRIITPDDVLETHVRKRFNLPEMSDEGKRVSSTPQLAERVKRR